MLAVVGAATSERGLKWNMGSRDEKPLPLSQKSDRLDRSFHNFKETFPFFLGGVLLVLILDSTNQLTTLSALVYLCARLIYVPLYVFGGTGLRSLVWLISIIGILGLYFGVMISSWA